MSTTLVPHFIAGVITLGAFYATCLRFTKVKLNILKLSCAVVKHIRAAHIEGTNDKDAA
jgi:hypothetical protein